MEREHCLRFLFLVWNLMGRIKVWNLITFLKHNASWDEYKRNTKTEEVLKKCNQNYTTKTWVSYEVDFKKLLLLVPRWKNFVVYCNGQGESSVADIITLDYTVNCDRIDNIERKVQHQREEVLNWTGSQGDKARLKPRPYAYLWSRYWGATKTRRQSWMKR